MKKLKFSWLGNTVEQWASIVKTENKINLSIGNAKC